MLKNSLKFLTPLSNVSNKNLILDKKYSQYLMLEEGSTITLSSDVGYRDNQEDSMAVAKKDDIILLLVADGMGGMQSGEIASYNLAKYILEWFESTDKETVQTINKTQLKNILLKTILFSSMEMPEKSGTTLNMSLILPDKTFIINVGDSRTYTLKDGEITLQTRDDSYAFEYLQPNSREERDKIRFYKQNNIITRAITPPSFPKLTINTIQNDEYDAICHITDGVSDILSESEIEEFIQTPHPANNLVSNSVYQKTIYGTYYKTDDSFAKAIHPGKDNATAIVYTKKRIKNN